ncbi:MAG: hypothetical protein NTX32_06565 [Candidatus Firestonebacteria bacterium]|nr:hypothetical protein [Candidatus Firestonebacteria bacterium]
MKKMIGALAITLAVLGGSMMLAEDKAPASEKKEAVKGSELENKVKELFKDFNSSKDASQEEKDAAAKIKKDVMEVMAKIFDAKLAEVTDKEKAEGYKAKKDSIIKNNFDKARANRKEDFVWNWYAPVVEKKDRKDKKDGKKKKKK